MKLPLVTIFVLEWMAVHVYGARILAVLPFPGKSHQVFHHAVLGTLALRGHQVVDYSPYAPTQPIPNYTHVKVYTIFEEIFQNRTYEDLMKKATTTRFYGSSFIGIWSFVDEICDEVFKDENIKRLLNSKEEFDLVMTASTFGQESMLVFGHKFGAPTITLQAFQHASFLSRYAGNSLSIATIPDSKSFEFTDQMSFIERIQNFISVSYTLYYYNIFHLPKQEVIMKKYFKNPNTPSLSAMVSNISLTLLNTHPEVAYPQPYTPNIIPIGGITIPSERIELPKDIKHFMDEAENGIVYFSFGTILPAHTLPLPVLQVFINVFKKLNNKVLWKVDAESMPGLSSNVKLVKWVPQPGVLAHPNCAVLVTHGGVFTQLEAIHAGVPVVGIPFFGDQPSNINFNEHRGIGIKLDLDKLTEASFLAALNAVLHNPKYKKNAKRLSTVFRDRVMSPAETTVYWVEYILRHGGAHLRPSAAHLTWYQLCLLDVLAVLICGIASLCWLGKRTVAALCCRPTELHYNNSN